MIPKTIFQSWKDNVNWPKNSPFPIQEQVQSWVEMNPDFKYRFFSDDDCFDFVKTEFPDIASLYETIPPIKRADLWRYLVIYTYGGVYVDIDTVCTKPLEGLLTPNEEFITGVEIPADQGRIGQDQYTNWVVIAKPKHPILKTMIEKTVQKLEEEDHQQYESLSSKERKLNVLGTTGPVHWSQIIRGHSKPETLNIGPEAWFAQSRRYHSALKYYSSKRECRLWDKKIAHYKTSLSDTGHPVYLLHTYLGTWKQKRSKNMLLRPKQLLRHLFPPRL